jgi:hypothetical protein
MSESSKRWRNPRVFTIAILISILSLSGFAVHAFQSVNIPLEVKEPLEIQEYPSGFSIYPGETITFDFKIENLASVTYFTEFNFLLKDTDYQAKYVTFSDHNYSIQPGIQKLSAWVTIAPTAPPANLTLKIDRKIDTPLPSPSASPTPSPPTPLDTSLNSSLKLLGGGARWAARNGTAALYINQKDNWIAHHLTDGVDWGPWQPESLMDCRRSFISSVLEQEGFEVTYAGDFPESLDAYDLVVIDAMWAVEPRHSLLVKNYLSNGGGVVILQLAPCMFTVYCKNRWPGVLGGADLTPIHEWFGSSTFSDLGGCGCAKLIVDKPFGTDLAYNCVVYRGFTGSQMAVASLNSDAKAIALLDYGSNHVFAFIHEYGRGRLYYQGEVVPK